MTKKSTFVPAKDLSKLWRAIIEFDMLQPGGQGGRATVETGRLPARQRQLPQHHLGHIVVRMHQQFLHDQPQWRRIDAGHFSATDPGRRAGRPGHLDAEGAQLIGEDPGRPDRW